MKPLIVAIMATALAFPAFAERPEHSETTSHFDKANFHPKAPNDEVSDVDTEEPPEDADQNNSGDSETQAEPEQADEPEEVNEGP